MKKWRRKEEGSNEVKQEITNGMKKERSKYEKEESKREGTK